MKTLRAIISAISLTLVLRAAEPRLPPDPVIGADVSRLPARPPITNSP